MSYQMVRSERDKLALDTKKKELQRIERERIEQEAKQKIASRQAAHEAREREDILNGRVKLNLDPMPNLEVNTEGLPEATARSMREVLVKTEQIRMKTVFDTWVAKHPEFDNTPENKEIIIQFLGRNNADVTDNNLTACLTLIQPKPAPVQKYTEEQIAKMTSSEYASAFGLRSIHSNDARSFKE